MDWIIEAVVENLDIKRALWKKIDAVRLPGTIVSSNTSGISIQAMTEGCSDDFKEHFLGTHFFNPPRYLKLLEIIPTAETKQEVLSFVKAFSIEVLGKGVVEAKDTPNFIANRIGTFGMLVTLQEMLKANFSVGEVDFLTGRLLGRPKSATFRTLDIVGIDTFLHVARNVCEHTTGKERELFTPPSFMNEMVKKGWTGSKSGQGFYIKQGDTILELNPETLTYQPRKKCQSKSIELAKQMKSLPDKLRTLAYADDEVGQLTWRLLKPLLLYSAEKAEEIAPDICAIDNAMKWGFGWDLGPFEIWDALGVAQSVKRMEAEGDVVPTWVKEMVETGRDSFYKDDTFYHQGTNIAVHTDSKTIHVKSLKKNNVVFKNTGAALLDLGDDVALLAFTSPNHSIGFDVIQMIQKSIVEVEKNYKGLVISNQGKNFCVGANLMMMLLEAQDENYDEIDLVVRQFQQAMAAIRYAAKPVVVGPFGMTLGGGAEVCLPAASIQASLETYIGLVEVGVGLIPGGGGNKELYLRNLARYQGDLQTAVNKTFETIALANVSTSAHEAMEHGYLRECDGIVNHPDHVIHRAKQEVLHKVESGYRPPERAPIPVVGETGFATMVLGAKTMKYGGRISDHDLKIAEKLAFVLAGGRVAKGTLVDEQYLLDLEREAFLSLISEPKSQQRMHYMLTKGKPLRN